MYFSVKSTSKLYIYELMSKVAIQYECDSNSAILYHEVATNVTLHQLVSLRCLISVQSELLVSALTARGRRREEAGFPEL